ncbi:MAG: hypothetical protein J6K04_13120 [Lachnospiraceae bacterium]|nr:hypothetical protein [Lachnospiraceae bacterium]
MKSRNRWVGVVLSFVMMVNLLVFLQKDVLVQGGQDVIQCRIPVLSNEYEGSQVNIYAKENRFYFSVDDIADFTRCSIEEETSKISLTQGVRKIVIEKKTGHMYDFGSVDQGEVLFFEQDGTYFYEAIPMLTYLGASCEVGEENILEVYMPMYTIWEAIMPEYEKLLFDMEVIHGGESDLKGNLICAMISDILDVRKGHGIFANGNTYIEDALHEVLKLDMMQYSLVQAEVAKQNQAVNTFLSSERVQNYLNQQEKLEEAVRNLVKKYISICKETKSEEAFDDFRKLYDETVKELGIKDEKKLGNYIKAGSLFCDIVKTSQEIMAYDEAAKTLFARTINDEILAYAGYQDIMWSENAKKLSKELESNQSIVASATIDKLIDATLDEVKDKGVEYALSKFVLKENIYATTLELAGYIASIINSDIHEAFYSERSAVYLNMIQYDAIKLLDGLLLNCKEKEQFSNEKTLENIKSVLELYYRASATFSAHMARSVEQFGEGNSAEVSKFFKEDVGNVAALYLYRVVNCKVVSITDYQELAESCRTGAMVGDIALKVEEKKQQLQEMESYIAKAERYVKVGNYDGAREVLEEAYKVSGASELLEKKAEVYLAESNAYMRDWKYERAIEVLIEGQEDTGAELLYEREEYLRENIIIDSMTTYHNGYKYSLEEYDVRDYGNSRFNEIDYYGTGQEYYEGSRGYWYDEMGRCVKMDVSNEYTSEYKERKGVNLHIEVYEYEYDSEGKCIVETYFVNDEIMYWYEYKYDSLGNRIKAMLYDRDGEFVGRHEYEYNEAEFCTKSLSYLSNDELISSTEYEYDEQGNCMREVNRSVDGELWRDNVYQYDILGNCVRREDKLSGDWYNYEYSYVYDGNWDIIYD